jgi:hypothetical protein
VLWPRSVLPRAGRSPRFGAIAGFGVAAHDLRLGFGAAHPDIVGGDLDQTAQHGVARQTEDEVHVIGLAPRHHLGTAIVSITTDGQPRGRPMTADASYKTAQMAADFVSRRCLAGPQQTATGREVAVS